MGIRGFQTRVGSRHSSDILLQPYNRALGSVPVHAGFVMDNVVMGTPGLPIADSPLLSTDLIKGWCIIRPEYQRILYF